MGKPQPDGERERTGNMNEHHIRKITPADVGRAAEIIVFNNRQNYYPIFSDIVYSFSEYTVANVTREFLSDDAFMRHCYVYEDRVIKGFVAVVGHEIRKLYVDSFFQNEGIGTALLRFAVEELGADNLWALEKNVKALRFYERNGFRPTGERCYEEGTTEFLIRLAR